MATGTQLLTDALVAMVLDTLQQIQVQENIALGNVDNTSDINKPVSTAQSAAIAAAVAVETAARVAAVALKAPINNAVFTGTTTLAADPTLALQAATKQYVDALGALKAPINNAVLTGTTTLAADPTLALQAATKQYVDATVNALLEAANAEQYKGLIDCSANPNYPAANSGHTYRVSVAGKIGGASGTNVEISDRLQCITDGSAAGTQAAVGANWWITQANIDGAVVGPASVTGGNPAVFSGTTGKIIAEVTFAAFKTSLALVKGDVGLGNVDNTSDVNKPVSTAQATADALALPKTGGTMTGAIVLSGDPAANLQPVTRQYLENLPTITAPTFANSWVAFGAGPTPRVPGYYKLRDGTVHLCGTIKNGVVGSKAFTLPVGFRPTGTLYFTAFNPAVGTPSFMIQIDANGDVTPQSGVNSACAMDAACFLAEQ